MNSYRFRKCLSLLLAAWAICLCAGCGTGGEVVASAPKRDSAEIVREMVVCYGNDGDDARAKVDALLIELDGAGYALSGEDCRTKTEGVFVAGDNRKKEVRQLVTAAADGAVAATAAVNYINKK